MMNFRLATINDVSAINRIYNTSKVYFKKHDINQWQNNYPNIETIHNDISKKQLYVLEHSDRIVGCSVLSYDMQDNYQEIYNGSWDLSQQYGVIHRIAVDQEHVGRGYGKVLMTKLENLARDFVQVLRIDTHKDNRPMLGLLEDLDYRYCGMVVVSDGERLAFEKQLNVMNHEV